MFSWTSDDQRMLSTQWVLSGDPLGEVTKLGRALETLSPTAASILLTEQSLPSGFHPVAPLLYTTPISHPRSLPSGSALTIGTMCSFLSRLPPSSGPGEATTRATGLQHPLYWAWISLSPAAGLPRPASAGAKCGLSLNSALTAYG